RISSCLLRMRSAFGVHRPPGAGFSEPVSYRSELHALKIDLFLHQQGLDTTTPAAKAMFQMMGVFAEFERAMIQERVHASLSAVGGKADIQRRIASTSRTLRPPRHSVCKCQLGGPRWRGSEFRQLRTELRLSSNLLE